MSESEFATKIAQLRNQFKHGEYWNGQNTNYTTPNGTSSWANEAYCNCGEFWYNGYYIAMQCHGYALKLGNLLFGGNPNNWAKSTDVYSISAGDVIYRRVNTSYGKHTVFVTQVTDTGVYYTDCNWNAPCMVAWDKFYSYDDLSSNIISIYKCGQSLKGNGIDNNFVTTMSVTPGTNATETVFSWGSVSGAVEYNFRIWNDSVDPVNPYWAEWGYKGTSFSKVLPAGTYRAYVDVIFSDHYEASNTVEFTVYSDLRDDIPDVPVANGTYSLRNVSGGYMMNVYAGTDADGTKVVTWENDGSAEQKFWVENCGYCTYRLFAICSNGGYGRVVDVNVGGDGNVGEGDYVDIWSQSDSWNTCQIFNIVPLGNNCYAIELNYLDDYVLGITSNSNNGAITLQRWTGADTQKWQFCTSGTNTVINPCTHNNSFQDNGMITQPTCTTEGTKSYKCVECGATKTEAVAALGHNYSSTYTVDKAATCTSTGTKSRHCTRCSATTDSTTIAATGHTYGNWTTTKAATCTADGTKSRSCSVCGAKETGTVAKLGHNYSSTYTVDKAATCTSTGTKSRHCTRCSATTDSTTIPVTDHNYDVWVAMEPTCTENGSESTKCTKCGYEKVTILPATGHTSSNWIIDWAATDTESGFKHKECTVCGEWIDEADIPVTEKTETDVEKFVERLYTIMLNRESDAGKQSHINGLLSGKTAAEIAEGFVLGAELKAWNISNEEFVRRMYLTFLDREADAEGLAIWTAVLDKGCSYGRMFRDFCNSAEFKIVCDSYGIKQGSYEITEPRDINENITHYCSRMYTKALGRAYDVDGLNNWAKALVNGTETPESIAMIFLNGAEFQMWNHSDEVFVDRLYETLFNRPADAEGKQTWLNLLSLGTSRKTAIETFVQSEEFKILKASLGL